MQRASKRVQVLFAQCSALPPVWSTQVKNRRVFKHGLNNTGAPMLTFKGFRRSTAKLAMPHVPNLDISIAGTELDVGGAQTVYVLQVRPPAPS